MDDVRKLVHAALTWIDSLELWQRENQGICGLVDDYCVTNAGLEAYFDSGIHKEVEELLQSLFKEWPKYYGSRAFPIPGGAGDYFGLRRWEGEYGELREELLQFLIEQTNG